MCRKNKPHPQATTLLSLPDLELNHRRPLPDRPAKHPQEERLQFFGALTARPHHSASPRPPRRGSFSEKIRASASDHWQKKGAPEGTPFLNLIKTMKTEPGKLFDALLGEAGALRCTLAGFELGVGFANHVFGALAADNLAVGVAAFGGGK